MKNIFTALLLFISLSINAQEKKVVVKNKIVETSCGQCKFGMKSKKGCDLAIRMDGKSYFVDGTKIDDHGDSHGKDGFCEAIRKAKITGEIVGDRFKATAFKLLPVATK
jgi:hypothetical protein